ncbi:hypothetical protein GCM10008018_48460 [Paenibacillus marchantiophytorum]|uniref:Uncharacterized protein n=1 Tax=Paenibacillus marchantiophytorum TaxID=1619310 RepID=A0ABQ1F1F6_9BACL|nr:hypothetical protein [Paenibacillus marchantiophytorum]GFZ96407.1 hypothetical protein GCM10008018_48460 [Paenibacillus marchantiophytorum]
MQKISRKKTVEGTRVPGIIKNSQYFYVNVDVYEDGMVNCWELVDLDGLEEKIKRNWLIPQVPDGEIISIHGLGAFKVKSANWKYDKKSYFKYIKNIIKLLNPKLNNLYTISREEKELLQQRRVSYSPQAKEFYVKRELFYETTEGDGFTIFLRHNQRCYLANLVIYMDGSVVCYTSEFELNYRLEEIEKLFEDGTLFTNIEVPTVIHFENFGEVTFSESTYSAKPMEKFKELMDMYHKLNGHETTLESCRKMYFEYLEYPDEYARTKLKELYELIPEHERIYLGDMDSRDSDYVRIIYHPEQKREV